MTPQTIELKQVPKAETALIVYSDGQVSRHPVVSQGQQTAIGAGNLLSADGLRTLFAPYSESLAERNERLLREFMPASVFCRTFECLGWTVKSRQAPMWFSGVGMSSKGVSSVPWCSLVFFASKDRGGISLRVFAIKDEVITPETALFIAPLMNINSNGYLCFGSATKPSDLSVQSIPVFEDAIYETRFSHVSHRKTLLTDGEVSTTDHFKFWKKLEGKDSFPLDSLCPTDLTVADLIESR